MTLFYDATGMALIVWYRSKYGTTLVSAIRFLSGID
jgi:hypothetical protein